MNFINRIKLDIQKDSESSKYKKFLAKIFGLENKTEESKNSEDNDGEIKEDDSVYMLGALHKDIKIIKTLILDLSDIVKSKYTLF